MELQRRRLQRLRFNAVWWRKQAAYSKATGATWWRYQAGVVDDLEREIRELEKTTKEE